MAKVSYYQNQLFVVGKIWMPSITCGYCYPLGSRKDENLEEHLKDGTIEQWVDMKAGDFQNIEDFRLEYFDTVIDFKNEESWYVFDSELEDA